MKTLVVTSNPAPDSFTVAVAQAFADGAKDAAGEGGESEVINLALTDFNPVWTMADREHYYGRAPMPEDVKPYQEKLAQADVICFVSPIYWYTMTAQMKGFFDRVMCRDFAYDGETGAPKALKGRTARFIMLAAGTEEWYRSSGVAEGLTHQIEENTFRKYCGMDDEKLLYVYRTNDEDADYNARSLEAARVWGVEAAQSALA